MPDGVLSLLRGNLVLVDSLLTRLRRLVLSYVVAELLTGICRRRNPASVALLRGVVV